MRFLCVFYFIVVIVLDFENSICDVVINYFNSYVFIWILYCVCFNSILRVIILGEFWLIVIVCFDNYLISCIFVSCFFLVYMLMIWFNFKRNCYY